MAHEHDHGFRAAVLTVSDGVAAGVREDTSGAALADRLAAAGYHLAEQRVIADEVEQIQAQLRDLATRSDLIVTTGGTGLGPRDVTPEATRALLDRDAPGLVALQLAAGMQSTPMAALSRPAAGTIGSALVVNFPGSTRGALESLEALMPVLGHALDLIAGRTEHRVSPSVSSQLETADHQHMDVAVASPVTAPSVDSIPELQSILAEHAYLADEGLATAMFLAMHLGQPLLLEGEAGVGKTEVAKALASAFGSELIRLQCYEGIDAGQALYEWDYTRQLLYVRALSEEGVHGEDATDEIFGSRFLIERPLLAAMRAGGRAVLLIDEIDRADDEFEAFLLEVLSDFQVTIPEIGTIRAEQPPLVVLTSNRTRELHDALKRRCLYHWIDFPDLERELEIVRTRAPEVPEALARKVTAAVERMREMDLIKKPGVAETIGWARALGYLGVTALDPATVAPTLGTVIKDHDDLLRTRGDLEQILAYGE